MSEPIDTTDVTAVPPAPPGPDAFTVVANLIALIADPREMQGRLAELKAQIDAADKAMRKLERTREAHDRAVAKDRAEIAAERAQLAKRQIDAQRAEASLAERREEIREFNRREAAYQAAKRYEPLPGGGVRDHGVDGLMPQPRPVDPHFDRASAEAASDETVLERVGPAGSTLTRSVPRPASSVERARRSMRRGQPNV